ncbi:MAG: Rossmann-like and DUF2520 domain-containing protein [Acidobacteriaceae bacterium]
MTRTRQNLPRNQKSGVTLIGLGNWGTALAHALAHAGIPVREIVVRKSSAAAKQTAAAVSAELSTWKQAQLDAPVLWLCTPDAQIQAVSEALAARRGTALSGVKVLHSSGVLSSTVLQAVAQCGASTASVHPLMSFPQRSAVPLHGVPFGVEGDAAAVRTATTWIKKMGGETFRVSTEQKALYHAFGTFSSPLLVAFLTAARTAGLHAGLSPREVDKRMRPIVERSLHNFFAHGADRSFSGPIARGDVATIHLHLAALQKHPKLERIYRSVAEYALDTLPAKKRLQLRQALRAKASGTEE